MERNDLKQYIIDKKESIQDLTVHPRHDIHLDPSQNFITALIGPRRAGKTYSMYDFIQNKRGLEEESYLFLDLENTMLTNLTRRDLLEAVHLHEEIYGSKPDYVFLDEIQVLDDWEKPVRELSEQKSFYLFVSGSSSRLLSREIASSLRGRSLSYNIYPLSFREFLRFRQVPVERPLTTSTKNKIKNQLHSYFKMGGFPDMVLEPHLADRFFDDYVDIVLFRDVIERHNVQNITALKFLIQQTISSFSKEFSLHKNYNTIKSQGINISKKTVYNYVDHLEDAMFCFLHRKFSPSIKKSDLSVPKVYLNDTGLAATQMHDLSANSGRLMENVVFLELKRRNIDHPDRELFYWQSQSGEVDFVIKEGNEITELIQVCFQLDDSKTRQREVKGLLEATEALDPSHLTILNFDRSEEIQTEHHTIQVLPLWKWLIEER